MLTVRASKTAVSIGEKGRHPALSLTSVGCVRTLETPPPSVLATFGMPSPIASFLIAASTTTPGVHKSLIARAPPPTALGTMLCNVPCAEYQHVRGMPE